MCGINGVINCGDDETLRRMTAVQAHRGPDDSGMWSRRFPDGSYVGLGSRRLAIIDLSSSGHMPMCNEDELSEIIQVFNRSQAHLMAGFNRRFAPMVRQMKLFVENIRQRPSCRVGSVFLRHSKRRRITDTIFRYRGDHARDVTRGGIAILRPASLCRPARFLEFSAPAGSPMLILGLNMFHADASAAIIQGGEVIFAVAEVRLNRIKH